MNQPQRLQKLRMRIPVRIERSRVRLRYSEDPWHCGNPHWREQPDRNGGRHLRLFVSAFYRRDVRY